MKPLHLLWLFPLAAAVGYVAVPRRTVAAPAEREAAPLPEPPDHGKRLAELARERVLLKREQGAILRRAPRTFTAEERVALGKKFLLALERREAGDLSGVDFIRDSLRWLDADLAHVFFESLADKDYRSPIAARIGFGVTCGGPDAEAWLSEALAHGTPELRGIAIDLCVAGLLDEDGIVAADVDRLPIGSSLLAKAHDLAKSASPRQRAAGLRLLGHERTAETLALLRSVARDEAELDRRARSAAIRALGFAGDAETRRWLESELFPKVTDPDAAKATLRAIARLKESPQ